VEYNYSALRGLHYQEAIALHQEASVLPPSRHVCGGDVTKGLAWHSNKDMSFDSSMMLEGQGDDAAHRSGCSTMIGLRGWLALLLECALMGTGSVCELFLSA
jgi:hypothetical protein